MTIDAVALLRVLAACDELQEEEPLVTLVFPKKGGGYARISLLWNANKSLKDYIRDPSLTAVFSLYQAAHSRILDHNNIKRRLSYVPRMGDELRFLAASPAGVTR